MIPLPVNIPWRLVGAVGLVAVVALMGWRVSVWREAYATLPIAQAELAAERACALNTECHKRAATLAEQARLEAEARAQDALQAAEQAEAKARASAQAWRKRYEGALANDPGCAEWASRPVACPIG